MPADRSTPAFYVSRSVPPLLYRMLAETDVGGESFRSLTWSEEIPPYIQSSQRQRQGTRLYTINRYSGTMPKSGILNSRPTDDPAERQSTSKGSNDRGEQPSGEQRDARPATDLGVSSSEGEEETEGMGSKIRKPAGEVGRPGRGGYNLENALSWPHDDFEKIKVSMLLFKRREMTVSRVMSIVSPVIILIHPKPFPFSARMPYRSCAPK